jgi:hypothetical protein
MWWHGAVAYIIVEYAFVSQLSRHVKEGNSGREPMCLAVSYADML